MRLGAGTGRGRVSIQGLDLNPILQVEPMLMQYYRIWRQGSLWLNPRSLQHLGRWQCHLCFYFNRIKGIVRESSNS